jgi:hypothetical protein
MPSVRHFVFLCTEVWPSDTVVPTLRTDMPQLFLSSVRDELIPPQHMHDLFALSHSKHKMFVSLPLSMHNDPWARTDYWEGMDQFWRQYLQHE